jgi:methionyl-tRNA synthetase
VNRAVVLTHKYFTGKIPEAKELTGLDKQVLSELETFPSKIGDAIYNFKFRDALNLMMDLARLGNKYLAETEPWKLAKTDMERVSTIMNIALQISASLSILMEPFLPFTSEKLRAILNLDIKDWNSAGASDLLKSGHQINKQDLLFSKIDDDVIDNQILKLKSSKEAKEDSKQINITPMKEEIQFDDFMKMDIRVGEILSADPVPKSNKLLRFTVDTGIDKRTILSGIAKHFSPEEMVGKKVTVLANLAPRRIMGIESQGMILFAENEDGSLVSVSPADSAENGATIS